MKPRGEYGKDRARRDGLNCYCRACTNARIAAFRKDSPEKGRAAGAKYRTANPEKVRARHAAYYAANPEKERARGAAWAKANPEKNRTRRAAYRRTPEGRDARRRDALTRRARKASAFVEPVSAADIYLRDGGICQICRTRVIGNDGSSPLGPTIDHIVPLSKGGEHSRINSQLAHRKCNSAKGNRPANDQFRMLA